VEVKWKATGGLSQALRRLMARCKDLRPAWEVVGMDLLRSVDRNFDTEGRPSAWDPWSPAYGGWRAEKKPGKILTLDGRLRRSITSEPDGAGVTLGTNVVYAPVHQFGLRRGVRVKGVKRKRARSKGYGRILIPARPFLVVQDSDWPKIEKTIGDFLAGAWA
jgi:phage virion morphogenesis protein